MSSFILLSQSQFHLSAFLPLQVYGHGLSVLETQRALCALSILAPERLAEAIAALYHAFFVEKRQIAKVEAFGPVLEAVLGKDLADKVLEKVCMKSL